jgi:outer membrane immunogenic protein
MKKSIVAAGLLAFSITAGPALAADMAMPLKAPPPPPAAFSWTGFYVGGNFGAGEGSDPARITGVDTFDDIVTDGSGKIHNDGWLGGVQIGYNWEVMPSWVLGFETDFQLSGIKGSANCVVACNTLLGPPVVSTSNTFSNGLDWFGTVRGRLGYAVGPSLFYFTGGLAYAEINRTGVIAGNCPSCGFLGVPTAERIYGGQYDDTSTKTGWTIGGGFEAKLWGPWSAKVEYLYVDLGHVSDTLVETYTFNTNYGAVRTVSSDIRDNIIRAGLNYQFNGSLWH